MKASSWRLPSGGGPLREVVGAGLASGFDRTGIYQISELSGTGLRAAGSARGPERHESHQSSAQGTPGWAYDMGD